MASRITKRHFNSRSLPGSSRFWLTCLLCLCAWRGPIPVVHSHSLQSHALAGNMVLAAHAVAHHGHDIDHGSSGWHVHFVMPAGDSHAPRSDDEPAAPALAWPSIQLDDSDHTLLSECTSTIVSDFDVADQESLERRLSDLNLRPPARPPVQIKRISPQAWLCVARC